MFCFGADFIHCSIITFGGLRANTQWNPTNWPIQWWCSRAIQHTHTHKRHSVPAYVLFGWKSMQCATLLCDAEHDICRQRLSHPLLLGPLQIGCQMQFVFVIPIINSILFIVQHDFTLCHCKLTWYDQFRYSKQIVLPELLTNFSFIDV